MKLMTRVELQIIRKGIRMCKSHMSCEDCGINSIPCPIAVIRDCEDKQGIVLSNCCFTFDESEAEIIKKWDLENPILY